MENTKSILDDGIKMKMLIIKYILDKICKKNDDKIYEFTNDVDKDDEKIKFMEEQFNLILKIFPADNITALYRTKNKRYVSNILRHLARSMKDTIKCTRKTVAVKDEDKITTKGVYTIIL